MTATLQDVIVMPLLLKKKKKSFIMCACMMKKYSLVLLVSSVMRMTVCHEWRPGALLSPQHSISHFHPWRCSRAFHHMALP